MLKQAARNRQASSEERQALLEAIQSGAGGSVGHPLALQVCHLTVHHQTVGYCMYMK